jgi:hypothetical protein
MDDQETKLLFFHGWPYIRRFLMCVGKQGGYKLIPQKWSTEIEFSFVSLREKVRFFSAIVDKRRTFVKFFKTTKIESVSVVSNAFVEVESVEEQNTPDNTPSNVHERAAVWMLVEDGHALHSRLKSRRGERKT